VTDEKTFAMPDTTAAAATGSRIGTRAATQ
jgi:hypothetical protein